ncbi:MAG: 50S ribosomal protein L11 [Acidimicrobiales bacterium]|jgi:large subunit ribosomal protein L11|nr:50S ribosomal protein L11 [Acidimicrobiales bacterium]HJM29266.1 50S ribosomal protein L11 [Acidimicrobiales bacterium]HJM96562.1 50S ribosomal protein L11 [Acidimicrobiales bacterium]
MAEKEVAAVVKIQIPAGQASPAPPVGTALGPHGIAIMDFCKEYNARTEDKRGQVVPVEITIYEDRTFSFITKTPPTSFLLRQAAGLDKASQNPGREMAGSVSDAQIAEIAQTKLPDLNTDDLDQAKLQVTGTARSMGIEVH